MERTCWLLYEEQDYEKNRDFAALMAEEGAKRGFRIVPVFTGSLDPIASPWPEAVFSRQRDSGVSRRLEALGMTVLNNSKVCDLCNDKRKTHAFLQGLPQMELLSQENLHALSPSAFPLVVKPACGHGGDRVTLVRNEAERQTALARIAPEPVMQQALASGAGRDLRVYVLFGQIVAGVMRTAQDGFLSNFKQGGSVSLHTLAPEEQALAQRVLRRFQDAGAPLCFAGIDLLYHQGRPVVGEVEDVVGSRMLYRVSEMNIVGMFLEGVARRLSKE